MEVTKDIGGCGGTRLRIASYFGYHQMVELLIRPQMIRLNITLQLRYVTTMIRLLAIIFTVIMWEKSIILIFSIIFSIFRFAAERTSNWRIGLITFDTEQVNVFDVFNPSRGRGEFTVKKTP